ncbi:MAG: hypothetical protein SV375_16260 [Thermodesulfobacteriota bacterium]|nr:hypothetical protein [Thermodesulfobacteriota bacterium]
MSADETVARWDPYQMRIRRSTKIVSAISTVVKEQPVTTKDIAGNIVRASKGIQEVIENVSQISAVAGEIA